MTISNYDEARAFLDGESQREITPTMYVWSDSLGAVTVCIDQECKVRDHANPAFGEPTSRGVSLFCRHTNAVTFFRDGRVYLGDELVKTYE